jgi:hypothetical protein
VLVSGGAGISGVVDCRVFGGEYGVVWQAVTGLWYVGGGFMKRSTVWAWYLVALLSGMGYLSFSRPGSVVSLVIVGLLVGLVLCIGVVAGREEK